MLSRGACWKDEPVICWNYVFEFEARIKIEVAWQLLLTTELIRANESNCSWNMQFLQELLATCYSLGLFTLGSDSRGNACSRYPQLDFCMCKLSGSKAFAFKAHLSHFLNGSCCKCLPKNSETKKWHCLYRAAEPLAKRKKKSVLMCPWPLKAHEVFHNGKGCCIIFTATTCSMSVLLICRRTGDDQFFKCPILTLHSHSFDGSVIQFPAWFYG